MSVVPRDADIRVIKLTSGEEVICQVEGVDDESYSVTDPFLIQPSLDPSTGSYYVLPWLVGADIGQTMDIHKTAIVCALDAAEEFVGGYIAALEKWHARNLAKEMGTLYSDEDEEDEWESSDIDEDPSPSKKTIH